MVLVKEGSLWVLYNHDKTKVLGKFKTKKDALEREREINYFKHRGN